MAASRLALISKKIIKPSSPTPLSHKIKKLSIFDQLNPCSYMAFAMFYPKQYNPTLPVDSTHISTILENSLSRALTSYYPLAGTIRNDGLHVECNDVGAKFLEAKIDCPMSEIFNHNTTKAEDLVFSTNVPWTPSKENLVVAQLNHFNCGGIAVSVCVSHKIVDGLSMINFTNHWSAMARNPCALVPSFQFVGGSIFPPVSVPIAEAILKSKTRGNHRCISKKYFLSQSNINSLKAMIAAESGTQSIDPSSVEAASAFVYKCMASISTRPSVFTQSVNLRSIMKTMLPEEFQGNASFLLMAPEIADHTDIKLHKLISEVRKEKEMYFSRDWDTKILVSTLFEKVKSLQNQLEKDDDDVDVYKCTSLSKFPFCDIDFGWGSPRMCLGSVPINKKIFLMDRQYGDGIEVLVSLKEEDMSALETNSKLLEFASPSLGSSDEDE